MKRRRRDDRKPLSVSDAVDLGAQLDDSTAKVAAVHGSDRAEHARLVTLLGMQTQIVIARRAWTEETADRLARALAAHRDAVEREHEAESTLMQIAARVTGRGDPCVFPRRRRCDSAWFRWFSPLATCEPARCRESEADEW